MVEHSVWIDKTEQQMRTDKFLAEFELCDDTGAWLFSTLGCFNRMNRDRAQQELTLRESDILAFDYYRTDDICDSILISFVAELQSLHIIIKEKTLEKYVLNHTDKLDVKESFMEWLNEAKY